MFNSGSGLSASDVLALTDRNNGGWGDNGFWWIIVLLFAWGGFGGYGFGGGSGAGAQMNYVLSSDFATLQRQLSDGFGSTESKLDSISNGICSLGYDQLAQMNTINTNILNTGYTIQGAVKDGTIAAMQNTNAIQSQLADCCCENRAAIAQVRYDMATNTCALKTELANSTRDIVDNANANTRAILDFLTQDKIATLQAENQALKALADNAAQTYDIVNQLKPCPIPAYVVANPNCGCSNNVYPYGYYGGTTIS